MIVNPTEEKVNIKASDLADVVCRKRERFSRFENALKDDPTFALGAVKRQEEKAGNVYHTDVNLSCCLKLSGTALEVSGKAAVLVKNEEYTLDVVKSLRYPVRLADEDFVSQWHNEAKCLAFILARQHSLEKVTVRISVFHTETLDCRQHIFEYSYQELEAFFKGVLQAFTPFFNLNLPHIKSRNEKNDKALFPFDSPREGQKEISKEIFNSIKNKSNVIINAPTGLGKTIATLYPAIKAQSKGLCNKVFYLTAKNSGTSSVVNAIELFEKVGYDITLLVITAKSRICDKRPCTPKNCSYPQGHHERVMSAVFDAVSNHKTFTAQIIESYAQKYNICPFVLQMELVWFSDIVVCDYNYVFDPSVSAKLSSSFSGNDVVLVDEAHNLIDRLRGIFSAEIKLDKLKALSDNSDKKISEAIAGFLKYIKDDTEDSGFACEPMASQSLDGLERELNALFTALQEMFEDKKDIDRETLMLLDSMKKFVDLLTLRSDDYLTFYNDFGNPEIFMVNTAEKIYRRSKELGSVALFSATLFPEEYYRYMLGARTNDVYVSFDSPFDSKNLLVLGYPLSTKYSDREATVEDVARAIWSAGRVKTGNYISFFPSYQYMSLALNSFIGLFPDEKVIYQKPSMTDEEKKKFISSFDNAPVGSQYAFAVLGGAFSEGIDLVGDKLSGAVVVGLGSLPPSRKSAIVSQYFTDLFFDGEKFAYHYPGLNKVFQAGGRVIRSETDRGFLLIIDDRFLTEENIELLPKSWSNVKKVKENNDITQRICDFWQT